MQERIIEIIVYLLSELQQERNKKDQVDLMLETIEDVRKDKGNDRK